MFIFIVYIILNISSSRFFFTNSKNSETADVLICLVPLPINCTGGEPSKSMVTQYCCFTK